MIYQLRFLLRLQPDNETSEAVDRKRMEWTATDAAERRPPLSRWHPEFKEQFERHMAQ